MKKAIALLSLLAIVSLAWAQTNPLQDRVRTQKLYRLNRVYQDSILNVGGPSNAADTLQVFRPAKWTTLFFAANGTFGTGTIRAVAWCGTRYSQDTNILVPCDTLDISSTGYYAWDLNVFTSDAVMPVFSVASTVGTVTIDSTVAVYNW